MIRLKPMICVALAAACVIAGGCVRTRQEKAARFLQAGAEFMEKKDYARAVLQFRNAVALVPNDAESQYRLGLACLADGKLREGIDALNQAININHHVGAQVRLAEMRARSGDRDTVRKGEKSMQDVLAESPRNTDALDALALAELQLGETEQAEQHLREALKMAPGSLKSSVELAGVYLARNETDKAEAVLRKAAAESLQPARAMLALGYLYLMHGRDRDAEAQFAGACKADTHDPLALVGLATAQMRSGRNDEAERTYRTLSGWPGGQYRHFHAAFLFAQGRREGAIQELEQIAKGRPADRDDRNRLVSAYLLSGRISDAEAVLAASLKAHPNDVDALVRRSIIWLRSGKDQEAEADVNRVLHFRPDSAVAHYVLAQIDRKRGEEGGARAELAAALQYNPGLLPARTQLAELLTLAHSPQTALQVLAAAPGPQANTLAVLVQRNWALLAAGDQAGFRKGVVQALKAAKLSDVLLQDAMLKMMDRDYTGARASAEQILEKDPGDLRALRAITVAYIAQGRSEEGVRFLEQYAARHQNLAPVLLFAGERLWESGRHAQARAVFLSAETAAPRDAPPLLAHAFTDIAEGRLDDARKILASILAADSRNVTAHMCFGTLETKAGNYAAAMEHYQLALQYDPGNVIVLNNLAYLMAETGNQSNEALKYAQQAREAAPQSADVAGTLGWVLYRRGLYKNALPYLQDAVLKDGDSRQQNAVIRKYHLAMTYFKVGEHDRGRQLLQKALALNPGVPEAKLAQAEVPSR